MKNYSHSPVTEMLSGKYKIWLMVGLALMTVADLSACIALWAIGAASSYWFLPFAMTVVDLLYLAGVALSNQRFKYARTLFLVYIVIIIVFVIIWLAEFGSSNPAILTDTVEAAWGMLHVVGILAVAISYLYASRRVRLMRHVQFALAIAFSAVMLLALVLFYGITVISDGYFGQGNDTLPLVYSYIGDDECEVTGIVYGSGNKVVIPYEFNGRKVTKVSANVFSYANVKSVTLNCDSDVELCSDLHSSLGRNSKIVIYADKEAVDTIKTKLYKVENDNYRGNIALGNNVRPMNLDKDEVYLTFDYDHSAYETANEEIIPTWYGKKGDTFRLSDIKGVEYVDYADVNSDDDLYYCYSNGGYIMSELKDGDEALNGLAIDKSRNNVSVRFQKVYKIFAGESNDSMYNTAANIEFSRVNGITQDYKLTVAQNAENILDGFDRGEAFTRTMKYRLGGGSYQDFNSIADVLKMGYSDITIAPHWTLVQPQITLTQITADADIVYGDDFELTASVTHPLGNIQVEYEWYDETMRIGYNQTLTRKAGVPSTDTYTAIATVSAPQVTSLTTANAAEITVTVNKRPLTVKWDMTSDLDGFEGTVLHYGDESVFNAKLRYITLKAENGVEGDYINLMGYTVISAGTHTFDATLGTSLAQKYYIAEGASHTYVIKPRPVALTWDDDTEFEYDGNPHCPTAHALDLSGEELDIVYSGIQTNAGENYTVTATLENTDYTIDDTSEKTKGFKITPKQVDVVWGNNTLTYNTKLQVPTASATGVNGSSVHLIVTGGQVNANMIGGEKVKSYYGVATTDNGNYTLNPDTTSCEFTIAPYTIDKITWTNTTVTYNGNGQAPVASAIGADGKPMTFAISEEINADEYTKQVTLNDNYIILSGASTTFTILPMEVRVEWENTQLTYNGVAQKPTATAKGVNGVDLELTVTATMLTNEKIGAGNATAAFAADYPNYTLINTNRTFNIGRKTLTATVQNVTIEYGQTADVEFTVEGIVEGDDVTAIPTAKYTLDDNGNIPVGTYEIFIQLDGEDKNCYEVTVVKKGTITVTAPTQSAEV